MPPVVDDLATLVAFPTVSNRPLTELAAFVAQRWEDLGFTVERFEADEPGKCNLVASMGPTGTDGLVLSGHMDVVPTEGQPWTGDPFRLRTAGDRLIARGTADMKGFLAAVLQGLATVDLARLDRELVLIWTHDEEVGCQGSGALAEAWPTDRPLPRACWIGEPTDFRVLRMHAGHVAVHVDVHGEAAHTSKPHLGRNAVELAAEVVAIVTAYARELAGSPQHDLPLERPWVPLSAVRIHGGTAINVIPDHCRVDLGYRPLPGMDPHVVFEGLQARLDAALGPRRADVHAHLGTVTPSMLTPPDTPLEGLLHHHAVPGPVAAPFATDGGHLARMGTAPLVFGPGAIDVAHKADEWIAAPDLLRTVDLVGEVVHARCVAR